MKADTIQELVDNTSREYGLKIEHEGPGMMFYALTPTGKRFISFSARSLVGGGWCWGDKKLLHSNMEEAA